MINDRFKSYIDDNNKSLPFDKESYSNAYYALRQRLKSYDVYRISTTTKLINYARERVCDHDKLLEAAKTLNGKLCDMVDENILQWFDIPHNLDEKEKAFLDLTIAIDEDSYGWHIESLLSGTGYEKVIVGESLPATDEKELQIAS